MSIPAEVFSGKPHKVTMGLRPLDLTTWLDADPAHPQRSLRSDLLTSRRADVYACLPGHEAQAAEVAAAVARVTGERPVGGDAPLVEAARLVRDDVCVLAREADTWILVAAVVCFPSRWRLADKIGRDVLSIHDPVPGYRQDLGGATRRALSVAAPRWRVNWTLLADAALFQPDPPASGTGTPDDSWFLRVERQCLVPVGDLVAFTIRTDVVALGDLAADQRRAVLESARTAPEQLAVYRGWVSR